MGYIAMCPGKGVGGGTGGRFEVLDPKGPVIIYRLGREGGPEDFRLKTIEFR